MPKAATAAGTGTPVTGNHSNAIELAAPLVDEEDINTPIVDPSKLGSHRTEDDDSADVDTVEEGDEPPVPARLKGKTLAQVYDEFSGLEREYSRQGQEVGELRGLVRTAIEMGLTQTGAKSKPEDTPDLTDEDFETNPKAAAEKMIAKELAPLKQAVLTAEQRATILEFDSRHPGFQEEASSSEFQDWVKSSPFRARLFKAASQYDTEAAEDLFNAWDERKAATATDAGGEETPAAKKKAAIKRNVTATGGAGKDAGGKSGKKVYKSSELMRLYIQDRERYNDMADEIRQAFAEGRVR